MVKNVWGRVFSGLSIASLLINSLFTFGLASYVYAQESPTPDVYQNIESSLSGTPSASPTSIPDSSPTPTVDLIPTPIPEVTLTPTPEITLAPPPEATPSMLSPPTPTPDLESSPSPDSTPSLNTKPNDLKSLSTRSKIDSFKDLQAQRQNYVPGEVIVKFKREKLDVKSIFGKAQAFVFEKKFSLEKKDEIKTSNIQVFKSKKSTEELVKELKSDSNVEYAQPNYIYEPSTISTNDTHKDLLWGLDNTGQTVGGTYSVHSGTVDKDIDAPEAWGISEGSGTIVAVIDSGVAYNHPDLSANMWDGSSCKDENGNALGGCNSGYDYEDGDKIPLPTSSSHGTHIAGTIAAAKNNAKGVIGVAPSAKIMAIKTLLSTTEIIKSISFAEYNGAKIINASWAGSNNDTALKNAIDGFSGLFIAAAGNGTNGNGVGKDNDSSSHIYPCDYDSVNIVCVAATDQNDSLATFSNYGATSVDVGAPGVNIYSTVADIAITQPLIENFDSLTEPNIPSGWSVAPSGFWGTYDFGGETGNVLYGDYYHYPYARSANTTITTPNYNLSGSSASTISFVTACDTEYSSTSWTDYMALEISNNNFSTSTELYRWDEVLLDWLNGDASPSGSAVYYFEGISIPSTYFNANFKLRYRWFANGNSDTGSTGDGCRVDSLTLSKHTLGAVEKYDYMDGTSMAAPHVAGLAALIEGYNSNLSTSEVKNIILDSGDSVDDLAGKTVSGKRINAYQALLAAAPLSSEKAISAFIIPGQVGETAINEGTHTIGVTMPFGTDVTALVPTITITGTSIDPASGIAQDFTNPVTYTVTAANSSTQAYIATVTFTADPIATAFDEISATLAEAPNDVANNLDEVTTANVGSFSGLYFEKSILGIPVGKLTFSGSLDLSDSGTQTFLQNFGNNLDQSNGRIALDVSTATALAGKGAALEMYEITFASESNLIVRDDDGNIIDASGIVSNFTYNSDTDTISFDTAHFTQFDIDITPPEIAAHADVGPIEATNGSGATATYTAPMATDNIDPEVLASCNPTSGSTFALGQTTVTCNKTDTAGNTATPTTFKVTVVDTTKPVIAAHEDITTLATSTSGATVSYTAPLATDNVDATSAASCTPTSGSTFPIGNTTVTCTTTDTAGNEATPITFTVTITENPPVLDPIGDKTVDELTNLTFTATAADPDSTVSYSLTGEPSGATINSDTGVFSFTPTEAQGPDEYTLTVNVTDGTETDSEEITITVDEVNVAPVATDDDVLTDEDAVKIITLNATDSDIPANTLTYLKVDDPVHGSVSITGNQATYTPSANYNGSDSFTFEANDGIVDSNVTTVSITVNPINDSPVANSDTASVDEDTTLTVAKSALLANDTDVDGDPLSLISVENPVNGSVSIVGDDVKFVPDANFNGAASFDYTVSDGDLTDTATVDITVNAINDIPVAYTQSVRIEEDDSIQITLSGSDGDEDSLIFSITSAPLHGSLGEISDNLVDYSPNADYTGSDSFEFMVNDGLVDSSPALVTITVIPFNDPPVLNQIGNLSVNEQEELAFTADASDPEGETLAYSLDGNPNGATINSSNGVFSWTPSESQGPGEYTFSVIVTDGVKTDSEEITVTVNEVNQTPTAEDISASTNEDTDKVISLSATDSDLPANILTYSILSDPSHGVVSLSENEATYTPESEYNGEDSFTFRANDGSLDSNTATASLTISPVNDAPLAGDDVASTDEDTILTIAKSILLANDSDIDEGDSLSLINVSNPTNGLVVISGSNVVFTPDANFNGIASFDYTVSDGDLTDTAAVAVTVNSVNDIPIANDGSATTSEDTLVTIDLSGNDVDGDSLIYSIVSGVGHGILGDISGSQVTYTPNNNYAGSDSFSFKVNDGTVDSNTATVTITINEVNDPPVLDSIGDKSVDELTNLTFTASAIDPDSALTYSLTGAPTGASIVSDTGVFSFTPTEAQGPEEYTLTVKVTDGTTTDSEDINISVNEVNTDPVAQDDPVSTNEDTSKDIALSATDSDLPADNLTYSIISGVSSGSLSVITGDQLIYTPESDYNGSDSFTFEANDGTVDSNVATVSITVNPINDSPVANSDTASTDEDTILTIARALLISNDSDVDDDTLSLTGVSNPVHGSVTIDENNVMFTPTANYSGSASFDYTVSDGSLSDTTTVSVTVNPANDAPIVNDGSATTTEDAEVAIDLLGNDVDGDPLTYSINTDVENGMLSEISDNQVTYTPNLSYIGSDSFTFKANDGSVDSNIATISITVNPPPVISTEATNTPSKTSITITWVTDHPSTSRVIYDTSSHSVLDVAPNYGYASSTAETDTSPKVTTHSVIVTGLTSGTTYYYRVISHGSPEVVGEEKNFATEAEGVGESNGDVAGTTTSSNSNPPVCSDQKPESAPVLVSVISSGPNEVTLTWTRAKDPVTYYLIAFGVKSGEMIYGNPNIGGKDTTSYVVKGLSSEAKYYFRVRAGNNCMPGDFSNEISINVFGENIENNVPEGFEERVLGEKTVDNNPSPEPTPSQEFTNLRQEGQNGEVLGEKTPELPKYLLLSLASLLAIGLITIIVYRKRSA